MKRILFFVFFIFVSSLVTKADTIEYCHVYYNRALRWDFGIYNSHYKISVQINSVQNNDSIQVYYFDDTPCGNCLPELVLQKGNSFKFIAEKEQCFSFAVKDLLSFAAEQNSNNVLVLYRESATIKQAIQIFMIEFQ